MRTQILAAAEKRLKIGAGEDAQSVDRGINSKPQSSYSYLKQSDTETQQLCDAFYSGNIKRAQALISTDSMNIEQCNEDGYSPLVWVTYAKHQLQNSPAHKHYPSLRVLEPLILERLDKERRRERPSSDVLQNQLRHAVGSHNFIEVCNALAAGATQIYIMLTMAILPS
jgi:hypothetical protein